MSEMVEKLRASHRLDAVNGEYWERAIVSSQLKEAADALEKAEAKIAELQEIIQGYVRS